MLEKVRKLKTEMGISYTSMAKAAGINYNTFKSFLHGTTQLNMENQEKLKNYLARFKEG